MLLNADVFCVSACVTRGNCAGRPKKERSLLKQKRLNRGDGQRKCPAVETGFWMAGFSGTGFQGSSQSHVQCSYKSDHQETCVRSA